MTANDSEDKVISKIAAAGKTSAWNIANFVIDGCKLTYCKLNLQIFANCGNKTGPLYESFFDSVSSISLANPGVASSQRRRLPKEGADKINKDSRQTDFRSKKRVEGAK